jgi:hypothetical protein
MKHLFFITHLFLLTAAHTTTGMIEGPAAADPMVKIKVWNNSLLPHKYTLIGYTPGETGNWTRVFVLLPGACHGFRLPVGAKIYRANNQQIGTVMGGGSIRNEVPFITVEAQHAGKFFRLNQG